MNKFKVEQNREHYMALVPLGGKTGGGDADLYGNGSDGDITWSSNQNAGGLYQTSSFTITSGTNITVPNSDKILVVFSTGKITVEDNVTVDASGSGGAGGAGGIGGYSGDTGYGDPGTAGELEGEGSVSAPQGLEVVGILGKSIEVAQNQLPPGSGGDGGDGGYDAVDQSYGEGGGGDGGNGGGGVVFVAPTVELASSASINVSGNDGQDGQDGASNANNSPGGDGGDGGHGGIFGVFGSNLQVNATVDKSGGAGGAGGTGYNGGGDGFNGSSGGTGYETINNL
ncbi:MAG: hypothetical protein ACI8Z7_000412 [Candidatus Nanohaloarchaea archaeon]|jgi:hypothetical protein